MLTYSILKSGSLISRRLPRRVVPHGAKHRIIISELPYYDLISISLLSKPNNLCLQQLDLLN